MNDGTFKLRVPTNELEAWREKAKVEKISIAEWIRRKCNEDDTGLSNGEGGSTGKQRVRVDNFVMAGLLAKCPHHKMKGELCYKCDEQFGVPKA